MPFFKFFCVKYIKFFLMFCVPGLSGYFIALSSSSPDHSSHIHASDTFWSVASLLIFAAIWTNSKSRRIDTTHLWRTPLGLPLRRWIWTTEVRRSPSFLPPSLYLTICSEWRKILVTIDSPVCFTHNGFQPGNILRLNAQSETFTVIDFEYCSYNYR